MKEKPGCGMYVYKLKLCTVFIQYAWAFIMRKRNLLQICTVIVHTVNCMQCMTCTVYTRWVFAEITIFN